METIYVPDMKDQQAEMNKPALEVGNYLAVVIGVAPKHNEVKGSYGLNWSLLINTNKEAITEGWDAEARVMPMDFYTYIGKMSNGVVTENKKGSFKTAGMLAAFDVSGAFNPSQVLHRQVIVKVIHDPSLEDQEAIAADPTHVVERYFAKVDGSRAYTLDGVKGPVLKNLADAAAESKATDGKTADAEY